MEEVLLPVFVTHLLVYSLSRIFPHVILSRLVSVPRRFSTFELCRLISLHFIGLPQPNLGPP